MASMTESTATTVSPAPETSKTCFASAVMAWASARAASRAAAGESASLAEITPDMMMGACETLSADGIELLLRHGAPLAELPRNAPLRRHVERLRE